MWRAVRLCACLLVACGDGAARPAVSVLEDDAGAAGFDRDHDGFTRAEDCDDGDDGSNPGAFDLPENGIDEDCSGSDATLADLSCDAQLALDSSDAMDGARALGLCKQADAHGRAWGVIGARYTDAAGIGELPDLLQVGLLPSLGVQGALEGTRMLALSSGVARAPDQPGYTDVCDVFGSGAGAPEGYPKPSPACPDVEAGSAQDPAALELEIRVPTNVKGLGFSSNFYTHEYPIFVCTPFNDYFVALLDPKPEGAADANIVFDAEDNPIGVNSSLLLACEPGTHSGKEFTCPLGTESLTDSGYAAGNVCGGGNGAATGWLSTEAPVTPGSVIKLRFAIWDSGDPILDSLALIDAFHWLTVKPKLVKTVSSPGVTCCASH